MRNSALMWSGLTVYFAVIGVLYLAVGGEIAGVTLLLIGAMFGGLIAGWLLHATRTSQDEQSRSEDRPDADISDGAGVIGVYPTASLRPLVVGVALTGIILGVVVGLWMTYASVAILASQVTLLARDADR